MRAFGFGLGLLELGSPTRLDVERLLDDLGRFRDDVEGPHDQIEEWSFRNGRILASVGSEDDESDPDRGHGWMCRLLDSEALGAAGFDRIRKAEIAPE